MIDRFDDQGGSLRLGWIIASHRVMRAGLPVGDCYREAPDGPGDSGWRMFSGDESQAYVDDPDHFAMYNASTVVEHDPALARVLGTPGPCAFERDGATGELVPVDGTEFGGAAEGGA